MALAFKIKTKSGEAVLKTLTGSSTINDLKSAVSGISGIATNRLQILYGFPPKTLDITNDNLTLSETTLKSGDILIINETEAPLAPPPVVQNSPPTKTNDFTSLPSTLNGTLLKKVVPADNSCLFSSLYFVLNGKEDESGEIIAWMRKQVAEVISQDEETYSEAILGKPNKEYCAWIQDDKSWGGAIELSVLSNHYGIEIAVVDSINAIINKFGEDQRFPHVVFLLFDGIHYDPLYLEHFDGSKIQTIFPSDDMRLLKEAEELAKEAKSSRQFTDVNKFTLKCLVCNIVLNGQVGAQQHAQSTGHMNFGEI